MAAISPHTAGIRGTRCEVAPYLECGVELALVTGLHPLKPLDDRLDIAAHFALEGRAATVVHRRVDRVSACQDWLGVGAFCPHAHATITLLFSCHYQLLLYKPYSQGCTVLSFLSQESYVLHDEVFIQDTHYVLS